MRLLIALIMLLSGVFLLALTSTPQTTNEQTTAPTITPTHAPGREPIEFPDNYRENLVLYATIDRADGISRDLYISPEAVDALENGERFPDYSVVLIEAFEADRRGPDGRLVRLDVDPEIHLAEARSTWQIADLAATSRVGDWNFGAFDARDGSVFGTTGLNDCFSCHEGASTRNFIFSEPLLEAFVSTGEVQYLYCRRSGRSRCF